jgi:hypothetical protein
MLCLFSPLLVVQGEDSFSEITEQYCFSVLKYGLALPEECQRFREVRANVQRRQSNQEDENAKAAAYIAFQGMNAHETLEAIRAREHGMPHQAKVQRRMTNPQKSQSTWF